jgi:hypothetical protein
MFDVLIIGGVSGVFMLLGSAENMDFVSGKKNRNIYTSKNVFSAKQFSIMPMVLHRVVWVLIY